MVNVTEVEITQDGTGWVLKVVNPGARPQEYRCATREQAQSLADVMTGVRQGGSPGGAAGQARRSK